MNGFKKNIFTVFLTQQQEDTPIAELQRYGLDVRIINLLENDFGAIYIRDLVGLTEEELKNNGTLHNRVQDSSLRQLKVSLLKFLEMWVDNNVA